jgi:hypothetical protein
VGQSGSSVYLNTDNCCSFTTLGKKVRFTIAEDEAFATSTLGRKPSRHW